MSYRVNGNSSKVKGVKKKFDCVRTDIHIQLSNKLFTITNVILNVVRNLL
jgi:hypothetical protein